jgi:ABC-2 type transport system permease protein
MTGAAMRLRGLLRKEIVQIIRDPSAILIAFLMPVVLLLVNGFGISLDATHMRVAVVIEAPEETVRGFLAAMEASPYLAVQRVATAQQAETALSAGEVRGMLVLRQDAASRLRRSSPRPTPAALAVDATDPNTARLLEGYITGAASVWLSGLAHERRIPGAGGVSLEYRDWFNPELRSADFIVPGIIAMVMTMTGTLLTALIVAREWERGTMESMLASPARMTELLAAKLGCYFVLGLLSMAGSVVLAVVLFGIPFRGSLWALGAASALFLLFALGLGLFISTLARNQFVASQFSFVSTMMPAMMLSGMLFDIAAMPGWLQVVTYAVPARYLVSILQTLFLAGDIWAVIVPNLAGLAAAAMLTMGATLAVTRRRLD